MSRYIEGESRDQVNILPICLDEIIDESNAVRIMDALVESFDMKEMDFTYAEPKTTGRKSYDPKDMLKIYIYGYFYGIRSSRKLERECKRNIELMWLVNNLKPDFKTIADFRKNNKKALMLVFKQFSLICDELKLFGKEVIAVDGSKFRANNARRKNLTKRKVKKIIEHYEKAARKYLEVLEHDDQEQFNDEKLTREEMLQRIQVAQAKIQEYEGLEKEIEKNGEISLTDPDAKHMSVSNNGTDVSHNVQIAVDQKHHLVAVVDVVSTPADQGQLYQMTEKAIKELNIEKVDKEENRITVLADKGYYTHEDLEKCKENKIKAIVPKQKSPSKTGYEEYSKDYFYYDRETDSYRCPQGQILLCKSSPSTKVKIYHNYEACQKCKYKDRCTKDTNGRKIRRSNHQDLYDEFDDIMKCNKELYKERQMIVEHPFGTIKRTLGYTYFLTIGNESVKAESFMHFFTYNLKRVINIVGIKKLIAYLKTHIFNHFIIFYKHVEIKGKNQRKLASVVFVC